jgi:ribose transport system substrate-binding protein
MIKLIMSQTKHGANDIKVQGDAAYISKGMPTTGKAIIIDVQVPASPKDTDVTNTAIAILNRVKSTNTIGMFCSNEGTVRGILSASNDGSALPSRYPGLVVAGFDAGKAQKAAVRNGYLFGAITRDPYNIGYQAVSLAYKAIKGRPVADIDTGAKFWDAKNMDASDIAQLLYD